MNIKKVQWWGTAYETKKTLFLKISGASIDRGGCRVACTDMQAEYISNYDATILTGLYQQFTLSYCRDKLTRFNLIFILLYRVKVYWFLVF